MRFSTENVCRIEQVGGKVAEYGLAAAIIKKKLIGNVDQL